MLGCSVPVVSIHQRCFSLFRCAPSSFLGGGKYKARRLLFRHHANQDGVLCSQTRPCARAKGCHLVVTSNGPNDEQRVRLRSPQCRALRIHVEPGERKQSIRSTRP